MNAFVLLSTLLAAANAGLIGAPLGGYNLGLGKGIIAGNLGLAGGYAAGPIINKGYAAGPVITSSYAAAPIISKGYAAGPIINKGYAAGPIINKGYIAAPVVAPSVQYQAKDGYGNLKFGYRTPNSARQEVGNAYGGVAGSYEYIDANGIPQRVDYVADSLGFRAEATNLPVAPIDTGVAPVDTGVAPEPVMDTEEVAAAKAEFLATLEAAQAAGKHKRSAPLTTAITTPIGYSGLGLGLNTLGLGYNTLGLGYGNLGLGYNGLGLGYAGGLLAW